MRKIIYSFLLLLSLTRSSECADSDKKEKPEERKKEYTYHYWDGEKDKPESKSRKITVHFDNTDNVEQLKTRIMLDLKIHEDHRADIDIYMIFLGDEKEPVKVDNIKPLKGKLTEIELIVFRKTGNVQVMPPLTTLVTLCNCKERSIQDTRILDDKTIGYVKEKFNLPKNMKLVQGSYHMGGKTVPQKRSDNTNLSDDTQLKDIMEESDKRIIFFVYPEDKVLVKEKFSNGLWNLSKEKKYWEDTQFKNTTKESDTDTGRFAYPEDKANYWAYLFFGSTVCLFLYAMHLKKLLDASKKKKELPEIEKKKR